LGMVGRVASSNTVPGRPRCKRSRVREALLRDGVETYCPVMSRPQKAILRDCLTVGAAKRAPRGARMHIAERAAT